MCSLWEWARGIGVSMGKTKSKPLHSSPADTSQAVDAFMRELRHPCKAEVEALREVVLGADPSIAEGIKWNAPSFRTSEYFGTTHLRAKAGIGLILHLGAKARELPKGGLRIEDPEKLLTWLGKDRAMVSFADRRDLENKTAALRAILRQWLAYV